MFSQILRNLPIVTKNLLIINVIMFAATMLLPSLDLHYLLGMHYFQSGAFQPYQVITSMFMHAGLGHIFFNMFALVMFGATLEKMWGEKRFLIYYLITGIGAVVVHSTVQYFEIQNLLSTLPSEYLEMVKIEGLEAIQMGKNYVDPDLARLNGMFNSTIVGASGAIYGLLIAFGLLFPNTELMLMFFPVPIKAKYFIPGLMVMEFVLGMRGAVGDNVAHFAHLGGALFGLILVLIWKKDRTNFY